MSVFSSKPALRWLVPSATAVLVIGGGVVAGTLAANAEPSLPARSAAQLLVDLQTAEVDGLSGTVVQRADLGVPALSSLSAGSTGGPDLLKLITGNNTARVWYAGEDKARLAVMSTLGETDIIRNGTDMWVWQSATKSATHLKLPAGADKPEALPSGSPLPATPQDAAAMALAAIDPTTTVRTEGTARVAGRAAYDLVLSPKDAASLIGQVRLAIDAEEHVPLRVEVYPRNANKPAVRVAFDQISFSVPDAEQFAFNPPAGTSVTEHDGTAPDKAQGSDARPDGARPDGARPDGARPDGARPDGARPDGARPGGDPKAMAEPAVVGEGWTTVVVAKLPEGDAAAESAMGGQLGAVLEALPKVSGTWGSGRLLSGTVFSALLTDDGRLIAGAVAPEKLYEVAGR